MAQNAPPLNALLQAAINGLLNTVELLLHHRADHSITKKAIWLY